VTGSWALQIARDDLARTRLVDVELPELRAGEALLRIDRVGLTANNVTYAVLGNAFRYWEFFPTDEGWGLVPLWGFAEVAESRADGVEVGQRLYGYLPSASHLVVVPGRVGPQGFKDASAHRAALPSPYNAYALTTGDPAYSVDEEDLQVLYRPLFFTSYLLADWLTDGDRLGGGTAVFSSASSKTAYGTAFLLAAAGRPVVGLTSAANVAFTESLGCYNRVLAYGSVDELPRTPTAYADFAGNDDLAAALRSHLGEQLTREVVVGVTQQHGRSAGTLDTTGEAMFFAPDQMRKRIGDWGRDGLDQRFAEAWRGFAPVVRTWVDVHEERGPEALRRVWTEVQAGSVDPRTGPVLTF
jgi:hypothetical protein